jgi:hypothetical protein
MISFAFFLNYFPKWSLFSFSTRFIRLKHVVRAHFNDGDSDQLHYARNVSSVCGRGVHSTAMQATADVRRCDIRLFWS